MSKHEYTPQQALELLMRKLAIRDLELATNIQAAVNEGKDVQETEPDTNRGNKRLRSYRRRVPYSPDEALKVMLNALRAHFIEQPLFINGLLDNLTEAAMGIPTIQHNAPASSDESFKLDAIGSEKEIGFELDTETELLREPGPSALLLHRVATERLEQQQTNMDVLRTLIDFTEASDGYVE